MGILSGKYTRDNYETLLSPDDYRLRDEARSRLLRTLDQLDKIRDVLTRAGRTIPQGALAWNWTRSDRTIPIIGFRTISQIQEDIRALDSGPLTDTQMEELQVLLQQ